MATLYVPQLGQNADIDSGAAEPLTADNIIIKYGVSIRALAGNSGVVYLNWLDTATSSNGYQLAAGQEILLTPAEVQDVNDISIIGGSDNQAVCWRAF
jgi:hypothetical protein